MTQSLTQFLDAERIGYAALFGIGLLLGVYAMLNGSIRMGQDPTQVKPPPASFNPPVLSAALAAFGATGYVAAIYSHLDPLPTFALAALAAAAGWLGMTVLMAKWALKGPIVDPHEELEELQGTIATVVKPIIPGAPGEISYVFRGQHLIVAARCIGDHVIGVGTEVVIEKIEDGVADVELWSIVEQRI